VAFRAGQIATALKELQTATKRQVLEKANILNICAECGMLDPSVAPDSPRRPTPQTPEEQREAVLTAMYERALESHQDARAWLEEFEKSRSPLDQATNVVIYITPMDVLDKAVVPMPTFDDETDA
jgi:hypothetical protein